MIRNRVYLPLVLLSLSGGTAAGQSASRTITLDDLYRLREVSSPEISPEGEWVAYTVSVPDTSKDQSDSDVWMTSWDGRRSVRLTTSKASEHTPRWSPDGRYLAFLSGRDDAREVDQVWLLNRTGGEAERITDLPGGVSDYAWSPDGKRLALIASDPDPDSATVTPDTTKRTHRPIVIDRFQFKADETGYLGRRRDHLYLFDLAARKAVLLAPGEFNEQAPAWSPDGKRIAFVSKRRPEFDRTDNWDLYVMETTPGAIPRQLTTFEGPDNDPDWGGGPPSWSPDGKSIAYVQGGPLKLLYYAGQKVALVPSVGGAARVLTETLDRNPLSPTLSGDGASVLFLLEDDRVTHLARVPVSGGPVERLVEGRRVVSDFSAGPQGKIAVLASAPAQPAEIFAVEGKRLRKITGQNDQWLSEVRLAPVEEIGFKSKDGTDIHGFMVKPINYRPGQRYPTILRIHGGPVWQFYNDFAFDWQLLAANGYVVVAANPRGSSGRGEKFSAAIWADWGNKDGQDVLAAVDFAVAQGLADPDRLGVGGWSYGGILTDQVIARDQRFKAAVSGAGTANALAGYGTDQYVREYEAELGTPWQNTAAYLKVSYPFLHADRIVTPTLFLCGEKDFNVPLLNSEQMYQALRSLGRETQLVIYPGEYHDIRKPSYRRDRLQRYVDWYDRHLKTQPGNAATH
ncbi:MAG TPA: S9 family peptidase [Gemmatimonadales bacterium]|nr:S9 family peptidase [Gemmatimonadales bacterium]